MSKLIQNKSDVRTSWFLSRRNEENMLAEKYKCMKENLVFKSGSSYWHESKTSLGANISIRKIHSISDQEMIKIENDIKYSIFFENEETSSILKIRDKEKIGGDFYIFYDHFRCNLEKYFTDNIKELKPIDFLVILKDIINALEVIHSKKIVLKNVSLSNMAYCLDNNMPRIKFFNLTEAQMISTGFEDASSVDIQSFGKMFLSVALQGKNEDEILKQLDLEKDFDKKIKIIYDQIKNVKFIESYKIKSFARLIVSILNGTTISISQCKEHFFFWEEPEVEKMIKIVNNCVDKNGKVKDEELIKMLNIKLDFNNKDKKWKSKLSHEVQGLVQKGFTETGCELIRFFRNKVAHRYDLDEKVNQFFVKEGGVLKYFFETFDDLYFILSSFYVDNRLYEKTVEVGTPQSTAETNINQPQTGPSEKNHLEHSYPNPDPTMNHAISYLHKNEQLVKRNTSTVGKRVDESTSKKKESKEKDKNVPKDTHSYQGKKKTKKKYSKLF